MLFILFLQIVHSNTDFFNTKQIECKINPTLLYIDPRAFWVTPYKELFVTSASRARSFLPNLVHKKFPGKVEIPRVALFTALSSSNSKLAFAVSFSRKCSALNSLLREIQGSSFACSLFWKHFREDDGGK